MIFPCFPVILIRYILIWKQLKNQILEKICHGILVSSLVFTVIGMELPGLGAIYLEQNLKFIKPVYIGDMATAIVKVVKIEAKIISLETVVIN